MGKNGSGKEGWRRRGQNSSFDTPIVIDEMTPYEIRIFIQACTLQLWKTFERRQAWEWKGGMEKARTKFQL